MVRRICPHCRTSGDTPPAERDNYERVTGDRLDEYYFGAGCNFCGDTGFLGRTGVFEILEVSEQIRQMVVNDIPTIEIRNQAIEEGMTPMLRDGMLKVKEGITTPGEILRNISSIE